MNKFKTLFFSIIIGLTVAGIVYAWTNPTANPPSGGGALYYSNGNVGIGTAAPTVKLELPQNTAIKVGNAYLSSGGDYMHLANNEWYNGSTWTTNGIAGALIQIVGQEIRFYKHDASGSNEPLVTVTPDGNVGIGTTNPTEHIDAAGYVKGRTGLCIGNDCRASWPAGGEPNRFGGIYTVTYAGNCYAGNPLTGNACSCPGGYTAYLFSAGYICEGESCPGIRGQSFQCVK